MIPMLQWVNIFQFFGSGMKTVVLLLSQQSELIQYVRNLFWSWIWTRSFSPYANLGPCPGYEPVTRGPAESLSVFTESLERRPAEAATSLTERCSSRCGSIIFCFSPIDNFTQAAIVCESRKTNSRSLMSRADKIFEARPAPSLPGSGRPLLAPLWILQPWRSRTRLRARFDISTSFFLSSAATVGCL